MASGERVVIIWNPHARAVMDASAVALREDLEQHPNYEFHQPLDRASSIRVAQQAAEQGASMIVAVGGDGTANAVANGILRASRRVPMAVLPLGTANDLSESLGLPADPFEVAALWEDPVIRPMDVVRVRTQESEQFFLNVASGGNSDRVSEQVTGSMKRRWGLLSYLRGAVNVVPDLKVYQTRLTLDHHPPALFEALTVILANGRRSGGHLPVAPRADIEDGLLDVIVIENGDALNLAALTAQFAVSDYLDNENVFFRRARRIQLECVPAVRFTADGELVASTPLTAEVLHRALPVLIGPAYSPDPVPETAFE